LHKSIWPISSATYMLGYEMAPTRLSGKGAPTFSAGRCTTVQKVAEELGFVPLPASVMKLIKAEMKNIK